MLSMIPKDRNKTTLRMKCGWLFTAVTQTLNICCCAVNKSVRINDHFVLSKFWHDFVENVASRVYTRFYFNLY